MSTSARDLIEHTRTCPACGEQLERTTAGNIIDYTHTRPCQEKDQQ